MFICVAAHGIREFIYDIKLGKKTKRSSGFKGARGMGRRMKKRAGKKIKDKR
jgi:hypothetical protein